MPAVPDAADAPAGSCCKMLEIEVQDLGNRQAPIRSKGGAIHWVCWDTGTGRLLPRLLRLPGRTFRMSGPAVPV